MKRKSKYCICGFDVHTPECRKHRYLEKRKIYNAKRTEKRKELREKHICTWGSCGCKIKPIIIFPQFCEKHAKRAKINSDELKLRRKEIL